jgi:hypothetical protein
MANLLVTAFNGGELSPYMDARTDVAKYRSGCRRLENMVVLPYGGVYRRSGTEFLGEAKLDDKRCRLIPFNFSTTTRFVLEFGHLYLRVWGNNSQVLSGGVPLEIVTPYTEDDLRELQYAQLNDIMYIAHGNYAPRKLSRLADDNWTLVPVAFDYPPLRDMNISDVTIASSASTGAVTLTASDDTFDPNHVGSQWAIQWPRSSGSVDTVINGNKATAVLDIQGGWTITTVGTWQAKVRILRLTRKRMDQSGPYDEAASVTRANFSGITGVASTNIITATGHTFSNDDPVVFEDLTGGTGLIMATRVYYVVGAAANTFQVSETVGGSVFSFSANITAGTVAAAIATVTQTAHGYGQGDELVLLSAAGEPIGSQFVRQVETVIDADSYTVDLTSPRTIVSGITGAIANNTITVANHRLNNGDGIVFEALTGGSGTTAARVIYYVINATTNTFQFSATPDGDPVNFTTAITAGTVGRVIAGDVYAASDVKAANLTEAEVVREFTSLGTPRNFTSTGTEDERVGLILRISDFTEGNVARVFLESTDFNSGGTVTIDSVASGTSAGATVNKWLGSNISATTQWSEAAFSSVRGYPRTVAFHEQRLCFGGTASQPNTVWCSKVDDFENFQLGSADDAGLSFTIASNEGNRINWIFSQKQLIVGTSGDEWTVGGANESEAFSATNISARRQASYGSKYMRAILLNDVLLFVQRRGRKVRELVYKFEQDGWVAPDLTVLAEHITEGEIVELAFQQQPDAVLWCVRGDGELIGMSYERDQEVVAWHRHSTDGDFESAATVYGLGGADDEVWLAVRRTINGQTKRYIERFKPDFRNSFDTADKENWWYLDCGGRYEGAPASVITGLSYLEGKTVSVLADGAVQPDAVVSGGEITLAKPASKVLVGLPYTSLLQPMKLDYDLEDGPTRGRKKRLNRVEVSLFKSLGGEASTDGQEWLWIYPRDFDDPMDASPPAFSGDREVVLAGNYSDDADLYLRQVLPYPLTIRALVAKLDAFGD